MRQRVSLFTLTHYWIINLACLSLSVDTPNFRRKAAYKKMNGENKALVVMYHYVLKSMEGAPAGIRPLFKDEFEQQLDWLENYYQVVSPENFLVSLGNGWPATGKPPCLLTFDDGTQDHWTVVAPILKRRSLSGLFFVLTWPSELGKTPVTHALHWIMDRPDEEVWAQLQEVATTRLGGVEALGSTEDAEKPITEIPG